MKEKLRKYWRKYRYLVVAAALLVVVVIFLFPYLSPGRALITNVYPSRCSGKWFGADRVVGLPDVLPDGDTERFNPENSAFYRGGDVIVICEDFEGEFDQEKEKFISARLGISLAIHEFKNKAEKQETPTETTEETPREQVPENEPPATNSTTESAEQTENLEQVESSEPEQSGEEQPPQEEPEQIPNPENPENLEQPPEQSEPVSLFHKFNDYIRHNIFRIFPALAQEEQTNKNVNQSLINESASEPIIEPLDEPLLIEIPTEINQPVEDLTPVFLPIEIRTEETTTSTTPQELIPLDAVLNIRYLLEENSYYLNTISSYPVSPAINNGYFYYSLPEIKSFNDLEKVKISIEGLLGGYPDLVVYLDSVWLEITYEEKPVEPPLKVFGSFDKNDWEIFVEKDMRVYQITDNNFEDKFPSFNASEIVWQAQIDGRWQIFWLNFDEFLAGKKEPLQITRTEYNNLSPKVFEGKIVWQAWLDNNWEIMFAEKNEEGNWQIERITQNQNHDMFPYFSKGEIFWEGKTQDGQKIFKASRIKEQWQIEELVNQAEEQK